MIVRKTTILSKTAFIPIAFLIFTGCEKNPKPEHQNQSTQPNHTSPPKSGKCRSSDGNTIFQNFSSGCLGPVCANSQACGEILEFHKDKTFSANALCKGQDLHDSMFSGTWVIQGNRLITTSTATTTSDEFCDNECEEDTKCLKTCKAKFLKRHGKSEVVEDFRYEFIDKGMNQIFMRLMLKPGVSSEDLNNTEAEWRAMGCMY